MHCLIGKTLPQAVVAILVGSSLAAAQISGLCNSGQTAKTSSGCTGVLVNPNPTGGGPNRDGNWSLAYPTRGSVTPCQLSFVPAWVDTPNGGWLANSASTASEWITPFDGENNQHFGWYVYVTSFPVPATLPGGGVPTGVTINGQLASDNPTAVIFLESPAGSGACTVVSGQTFPVNPAGNGGSDFQQWWPFAFTNSTAIMPGSNANLYFVVANFYNSCCGGSSPTGLRVEFFASSTFH